MYAVKLRKIESNHNNLRTNEVVGWCPELPQDGISFFMYAKSLDSEETVRFIKTTTVEKVTAIHKDANSTTELIFQTKNSIYSLEVIDESEIPDDK